MLGAGSSHSIGPVKESSKSPKVSSGIKKIIALEDVEEEKKEEIVIAKINIEVTDKKQTKPDRKESKNSAASASSDLLSLPSKDRL